MLNYSSKRSSEAYPLTPGGLNHICLYLDNSISSRLRHVEVQYKSTCIDPALLSAETGISWETGVSRINASHMRMKINIIRQLHCRVKSRSSRWKTSALMASCQHFRQKKFIYTVGISESYIQSHSKRSLNLYISAFKESFWFNVFQYNINRILQQPISSGVSGVN